MLRTYSQLDVSLVKQQAYGHWLEIIQALAPGMFDEAARNLGKHVSCPFHGGDHDFRFVRKERRSAGTAATGQAICTCGQWGDGFALLQQATGKPFKTLLEEVHLFLGGTLPEKTPALQKKFRPAPQRSAAQDAQIFERIRELWNAGKKIGPDAHSRYLQSRGISAQVLQGVRSLRFISQLGYFERDGKQIKRVGTYPAMLGLLRNGQGNPVAVHRTWLSEDQDGKAPVSTPKKLSQTLDASGAAIRLFDPSAGQAILAVAEGIETALAVRELAMLGVLPEIPDETCPVWACFAEGNIRNLDLPKDLAPSLKTLVVMADHDESGVSERAGEVLKERLAREHPHICVKILKPQVIGWDWMDYLVNLKS